MEGKNKKWYTALNELQAQGLPFVLATIVKTSGSAPRDIQAKMVITETASYDTIGGGGLEYDVISSARDLLHQTLPSTTKTGSNEQHTSVFTKHYPLGAKLGQCCGGSVTVMFECFNLSPPLSVLVFGAGHVANALIGMLSQLNCQVKWIDNREDIFDSETISALESHIITQVSDDPTEFIRPYNTPHYVLVMTHDHGLDFEIVKKALEVNCKFNNLNVPSTNDDVSNKPFPFIGCIASKTKTDRFQNRLIQRGFEQSDLIDLHMPIGLPIGGKEPTAVAISIMAQVLQDFNSSPS
ncbi:xanthine dehydrogenase accessory protein XdhC [Psychrobacter sanguinis]|uniref:xanthine dehydrogenase accessory protein XdhC n=1 Tax=Psychrobacter sanguinis TaxID=861445 RepID=UPI0019190489|nr:xanthine dehydrogenase accessory protein XdhC [Psychrobacter sanguinis]MCC3307768.1 xanthine dehydrogenase accessory protein XdhC [Psychrobacter sanguinis]